MKVFLSSTYVDLIEHRKAAHDALEQLGLHVIWMESFGARPEESTKACLDEIEESDLFVGVYAHRYGYVPEGTDISITEEEFNHAQKLGKPIFGFVVKADHPWNLEMVEFDKKRKLNSLLTKVKQQPIGSFTTPESLASSIAPSVGRYLLKELQKKAQDEGEILFNKLRRYLDSTSKKKIEDELSSFLANIQQASRLARVKGVDGFAELVEFCMIRASLLQQTRLLPADYYAILALIDSPKEVVSKVENIGNFGNRALAYAALAGSSSFDPAQREEFAQKALELSKQHGGTWDQSSNQSEIGRLLINDLPVIGLEAFKLLLDTCRKVEKYEFDDGVIVQSALENLEDAYRQSPHRLFPVLLEFITIVGKNAGYVQLLDLAKVLFEDNHSIALEILEKSYLELTSENKKNVTINHLKERIEREVQINKKHFVEVSLLLGRADLAEDISQNVELDFDLDVFLEAINNIKSGNFFKAIEMCSSSTIRQEAVTKLFELGQIRDAIQIITNNEIGIATKYSTNIVDSGLVDELLLKVSYQSDHVVFKFVHQENLIRLKVALIKDLLMSNPAKAKELLGTLIVDKEESPLIFPYWGDAALITESEIKWGDQKAQELISMVVDNFEKELADAEQLSELMRELFAKENDQASSIKDSLDKIASLGKMWSELENNFFRALFSYKGDRNMLIRRLDSEDEIPQELITCWEFIEQENWLSTNDWIDGFNFSERRWKYEDKLLDIVQRLVFHRKIELATKFASHLEGGLKWSAETWISSSSLLDKIDAYDLEGFNEPSHIFLIRAKLMSRQNQDLANAYVRLYCEFLIQEKRLDDFLGWDLCNLALFLFEHDDKSSAHKYFSLGIQQWFRSEMDDTWNEITEKLMKTDFEFQFKLIQEILLWNSNRSIRDTVLTIQMFAIVLVSRFHYDQVVSLISAIKRTRNWHLKDEIEYTEQELQ